MILINIRNNLKRNITVFGQKLKEKCNISPRLIWTRGWTVNSLCTIWIPTSNISPDRNVKTGMRSVIVLICNTWLSTAFDQGQEYIKECTWECELYDCRGWYEIHMSRLTEYYAHVMQPGAKSKQLIFIFS